MKESTQFVIFKKVEKGKLTKTAAAKALGLSVRWVRKKFKRYLENGPKGLVHGNRGKPSKRKTNPEHIMFAMKLLQGEFEGFGPTFASEKLFELYGIRLSKEVLRKAMIEHGIWTPKKRKPHHRIRRERKDYFGQMIQLDGSPHAWFGDRGKPCTLLVFIDDATSFIPHMELVSSESRKSVMLATRTYVEQNGRPKSFYFDYGSVFSVNINNPERDKITQYERVCRELDLEAIHARSPQAKGRVERSNRTHQDRLVKELQLAGISTIEEANEFIQKVYLPKHNERYAIPAAKPGNVHRDWKGLNLDNIFCIKVSRIVQNDFTIQYKNQILQIHAGQRVAVRPKDKIIIHEQFDGKLRLFLRSICLSFTKISARPIQEKPDTRKPWIPRKPAQNHPWRSWDKPTLQNGGY